MATAPILTARALADFIRATDARRRRILFSQKYPKEGEQRHRTPYYSTPLAGIRWYYRRGNDASALSEARQKILSIGNATRRENNERVLRQFEANDAQFARRFAVQTNHRYTGQVSSVVLKLSSDMQAMERNSERFIYYHWKGEALRGTVAETTLTVAAWVLQENGVDIHPGMVEFIDLFAGKVYRLPKRVPEIPAALKEAAKIIEELWPDL